MPIKRNEFLQAISREHHQGLLLSWKIKTGFKKEVNPLRMKRYTDWYYTTHLLPHFEVEERYIFPILGNEHELVLQALAEHERLVVLFESEIASADNLHSIQKELEAHIRFEERVLFNEIQEVATQAQLEHIRIHHTEEKFVDNLEDAFWL
ncbi:hemerythrin domain-containing protein [Flavobacterium sp. SM2513]|uniref:hemerythrin domain-containing protein n=1 Tax=Flavobacterium sp. SM2513 TaxID=3424766 RepID=UPI003D7F7C9D